MDKLWAPWRRAYVFRKERRVGCLFCRALRAPSRKDPKTLVLLRSPHTVIILNRFPYNNGHLMVVPRRHVSSLEKLKDGEQLDLLQMLNRSLSLLRRGLGPQGYNVGLNLGRAGGAGVPGHLHLHVVPRWVGDTNFMPVLTATKVISDSLDATYQRLKTVIARQRSR